MAHSQLNRRRMLGWIEHCLAHGQPLPTDAEIVDEFGFHRGEQARTLLADLHDRGAIVLRQRDGGREIALPVAAGPRAPRPEPPPDPDVAKVAATIAAIARRKRAEEPAPPPTPAQQEEPAMPQPSSPTAKRTVGAMLRPALHDRVKALAEARGQAVGNLAAELIERALDAADRPAPPPPGKPHLSAAVLRAAHASDLPFWTFITRAIEAGAAGVA